MQGFQLRLISSNPTQQLHLNPPAPRPVRMCFPARPPKNPLQRCRTQSPFSQRRKSSPVIKEVRKINQIPRLPQRCRLHSQPFRTSTHTHRGWKPLPYHSVHLDSFHFSMEPLSLTCQPLTCCPGPVPGIHSEYITDIKAEMVAMESVPSGGCRPEWGGVTGGVLLFVTHNALRFL